MLILASAEVVDLPMSIGLRVTESAPAPQVQPRSGRCTTRQGGASPGRMEKRNQIQVQFRVLLLQIDHRASNNVMFNYLIRTPTEDNPQQERCLKNFVHAYQKVILQNILIN